MVGTSPPLPIEPVAMPHTLRTLEHQIGSIPAGLVTALAQVDERKGRAQVFSPQHPAQLKTLIEIARIQSTEASNEIEGITAPPARIAALVREKSTPENRSEQEIAGYRAVLDLIHSSADAIPVTNNVLLQLHRDMYQFTPAQAGRFKTADNVVEETLPDGTRRVRFQPLPAFRADAAMNELNDLYAREVDRGLFHPLLLIGSYVFDFLAIHPFADGNGRMSRLLTLLLLYRQGYGVGRYISLEKLVMDSKETYYDALAASTTDWHEEDHSILPWLQYFVGIMVAAYDRFDSNAGAVTGRGSKSESIKTFIRASVSEEFSIDDVRAQVPSASDSLIRKVLHDLRDTGAVKAQSGGRGAKWRRLHRDF